MSTTGDCEDAALVKEQALIDAGYPAELMGIGTGVRQPCNLPINECHHTVLLVRLADEILVLDILKRRVVAREKYGMVWSWFPEYLRFPPNR